MSHIPYPFSLPRNNQLLCLHTHTHTHTHTQQSAVELHVSLNLHTHTYTHTHTHTHSHSLTHTHTHTVAPILEQLSTQLRWRVGTTAILQTRLVDANPNTGLSYHWLSPSGAMIPNNQYAMLTINGSVVYEVSLPDLTEASGGTYSCVVWNNISHSSQTFELFVTGEYSSCRPSQTTPSP